MSIQSEINRIKSNVAGAYATVEEQGGTVQGARSSDNLAAAIQSLAEALPPEEIPDYVKNAALDAARKVAAVRTASSIVFLTLADPHHALGESSGWAPNINAGNLDAARAVKALSYVLPLDFFAFLGDLTFGYKTTTRAQFSAQCEEFSRWMGEALRGLPQLWTPGNHDTGEYYAAETGSLSDLYGADLIKEYFADRNTGAVYGDTTMGYCCRDFPEKKLRVICLNTVEGEVTAGENDAVGITPAQLLWFAQTLYSLGSRTDASGWGFLVLGHYPLDWGYSKSAGKILKAYLDGASVTVNGTAVNFSGHNGAVCYGNFHGHTHNFKTSKLYVIPDNVSASNPPTEQMDALRIAVPCSCFYRANEVGENNRLESNYIEYGEETTYSKTAGTADNTAFCVNVINPEEKKIYSFCYGAGYDRTLSYDFTVIMRLVTMELSHCSSSNPATAAEQGKPYTATLTPENGYAFDAVTVTMGGTDITASVYSGGVISIPNVTGDIAITAAASKPVYYTNQVDNAVDSSGNPAPYQDGYSISSSGAASAYGSIYTCTGFIPLPDGSSKHIYRIGGEGITFSKSEEYNRIAWYDANFALLQLVIPAKRIDSSEYYPSTIPESTTAITFKVTNSAGDVVKNVPANAAYFRIGASGKGANLIVTLDEEII